MSEKYEGGGHEKAAGCTIRGMTPEDAAEMLKKDIMEELARAGA